ncbi:hypothetical protein SRHO_G00238830 [Serrasalmus rhombeus]
MPRHQAQRKTTAILLSSKEMGASMCVHVSSAGSVSAEAGRYKGAVVSDSSVTVKTTRFLQADVSADLHTPGFCLSHQNIMDKA